MALPGEARSRSILRQRMSKRITTFITMTLWLHTMAGVVAAEVPNTYIQNGQFMIDGEVYKLKGTNYYPKDHVWAEMWTSWDWITIRTEVRMLRDYGMNCVRILCPYSHGGWDGPNVPESRLQMLEDLVNYCGEHGIRSVVTIFDWETSFPAAYTSKESQHLYYVSRIVNRLKDNPYVLFWDVKNEPDHPDNYGWCTIGSAPVGNWDCNPSKRDQIVSWLHRMCDAVRAIDTDTPVTAGMRWWQNMPDVLGFVDVAAWHEYFDGYYPVEDQIWDIKYHMWYLMGVNKPIVMEEWGWPSNPASDFSESEQLAVYQAHIPKFISENIAGGLQWRTFDSSVYISNPTDTITFEDFFGLWKYNYTLKPAGIYYRDNYPVKRFPATPPPAVSPFSAETKAHRVELAWTSPVFTYLGAIVIRGSTTGYPANIDDGRLVCRVDVQSGASGSFIDTEAVLGQTNYYTIFALALSDTPGPGTNAQAYASVPGDFDSDSDVDLTDFGYLQACFSGEYITVRAGCEDARIDDDNDVDQEDYNRFLNCLSGSDRPADLGCLLTE